ncbi:similar to Saccharomyces cerevisiae YOR123C LEO1 Component of the Paf1 complex [Maudiozyma saulgeensis]|uniref:Similar to Saccharomyces cerevisiae YOR123C LEO1 Component of the Paf1 complex n=1 Tax=Maudiozyma saulgeensis TaxID=1789683 RepID=A0A1X7QYN4_9SACH|nr:similar to Saccharomyces cerevisiae YOR123C LEO1 Component of the Paf1 complex [Kazachstania saulgeensis]
MSNSLPIDQEHDESVKDSTQDKITESTTVEESKSPENEEMDDLFGDEEEEDDDIITNRRSRKGVSDDEEQDEENENNDNYGRARSHDDNMDEEEAMYTRKFYGEDVDNYSADEDGDHVFKEEDVELVRHMVPYTTNSHTEETSGPEEDKHIYYAKVPQFLTIDPVPFDPPSFEDMVTKRLSQDATEEDKIGDHLVDENTIRWRYSRDENQRVFKESNARIVKWSDGSYSLKLGSEYTDILVNDTDNTFLTVSHDKQELMQCVNGGEINKTIMFIPTSTNSKIHQRLSKAVARRNKIEHDGPGTFLIQVDPEIEKKELETKQQQIFRERRRRQIRENELLDAGEATPDSFGRRSTPKSSTAVPSRRGYQDEYEEDDFLVDDDEDENEYQEEDDEEEDERDILDASEEEEDEEEERRRAERLKNMKRSEATFTEDDSGSATSGDIRKKRRAAVISDDDDDE